MESIAVNGYAFRQVLRHGEAEYVLETFNDKGEPVELEVRVTRLGETRPRASESKANR